MILAITIVKVIVIDFWFFFEIAANAKQKDKSEISVKYISDLFDRISSNITATVQTLVMVVIMATVLLMT